MRTIEIPKINHEEYLKAFRALDYDYLDSISEKEDKALESLFNSVNDDDSVFAYTDGKEYQYRKVTAKTRKVLHHSAKYDCLQLTTMIVWDDGFDLMSDIRVAEFRDLSGEVSAGSVFFVDSVQH